MSLNADDIVELQNLVKEEKSFRQSLSHLDRLFTDKKTITLLNNVSNLSADSPGWQEMVKWIVGKMSDFPRIK